MCDFIPQLKGGTEVHVVRPRVSVENELADWKTTKNEKLARRFSHNHTCKNYADIRLQHPAKMSFFCTNESSVMLRRKWKKKIKIKKNKRRLGGKILHHSLSNIFAYRCKSDRGSVGVLRWFSSQRRCPVCRGPTAERVPSPPAPPPPSLSPSSQLTVGTWFKLYSLALSRRLAMLLAMFIPWDVLVLEQVGG